MYLLDTNVVSGMRRRAHMTASAARWLGSTVPSQLYISAITIFEIEHGLEKVGRRDAKLSADLADWLQRQVIPAFAGRILSLDVDAAMHAAKLHRGRSRLNADLLVAAIARAHGMMIVTRNVRDFKDLDVRVLNPFVSRS